ARRTRLQNLAVLRSGAESLALRDARGAVARAAASRARARGPPARARRLRSRLRAGRGVRQHDARLAAAGGEHLVPLLRGPYHGVSPRRLRRRTRLRGITGHGPPRPPGRLPPGGDDAVLPPGAVL